MRCLLSSSTTEKCTYHSVILSVCLSPHIFATLLVLLGGKNCTDPCIKLVIISQGLIMVVQFEH